MRRILKMLLHALAGALCVAPVYVLIACEGLDYAPWAFFMPLFTAFLAVAFSFVPGKIGNRRREVTILAPSSSGGDPNPDRERPVEEVRMKGISIPLRFPIVLLFGLTISALQLWDAHFAQVSIAAKILAFLCGVLGIVFLSRDVVADEPLFGGVRGVAVGMVLYAVASLAAFFVKSEQLNDCLLGLVCLFLLMCGILLNDQSLAVGVSSMQRKNPPRSIVRRNRAILVLFAIVAALVAYFDKVREGAEAVGNVLWRALLAVIRFLMQLYPMSERAGGGNTGGGDMLGALEGGETAPFWRFMEKVAVVLAIVIGCALLLLLLRAIYQKLRALLRILIAKLRELSDSMSEDYRDETESLFDTEDVREALRESVVRRLRRVFARGKKWEAMDLRERARHIVKQLYKKYEQAIPRLSSRTAREALSEIPMQGADKDALIEQYEIARYSEDEPDGALLEQLKKAVGA